MREEKQREEMNVKLHMLINIKKEQGEKNRRKTSRLGGGGSVTEKARDYERKGRGQVGWLLCQENSCT